jgi:radical SAM protein with 4Fe4S-binding SPASM domain
VEAALIGAGLVLLMALGFAPAGARDAAGAEAAPPTEMQNVTCYKMAFVPPGHNSFQRLSDRLPLLEKLAASETLHREVVEKVLVRIEADIRTLGKEESLKEFATAEDRQAAEKTRDAARAAVLRIRERIVPQRTCYLPMRVEPAKPGKEQSSARQESLERFAAAGRLLPDVLRKAAANARRAPVLASRSVAANLITNGSLVTEEAIARLAPDKISVWELPLLSVDRAVHDRMSGAPGAFDRVTMAVANLKAARQRVVTVFVATRINIATWPETAELAFALGADGIMLNRFNPGGEGARHIAELQASPEELSRALDQAEAISEKYGIPISCSIAMPPCLFDTGRYKRLSFGFCAAGTARAYYTIDPAGNLRPCNDSPTILGNVRERNFWDIVDGRAARDFAAARPQFCSGCRLEETCLGGCKAAAEACGGDVRALDPFLAAFAAEAVKPA